MEINDLVIKYIEKALKVELYDWQKQYLLGEKYTAPKGRGVGRTFVHIIKTALSDGRPLDLRRPNTFSDYGDGSSQYVHNYYRRAFLEVYEQLKMYGFPVREVKR